MLTSDGFRGRVRTVHGWLALIVLVAAGCVHAGQQVAATRQPPSPATTELNLAADPDAVLASARTLMLDDANAALITVDATGQPRSRTVMTLLEAPDVTDRARGVTAWIMTRAGSRKLAQIQQNPNVTLYYSDDEGVRYASIMGTATIHTDPEHARARPIYMAFLPEDADRRYFWPRFPDDFVMIEVRPRWLEYMGQADHHPDTATWRPQAVVFDRSTPHPALR